MPTGTGNLREIRPGVWELRVDRGRDPITHRRRQVSHTYKGSKRDARKALAALVTDLDQGRHRGTDETVGLLLAAYLDHLDGRLSPSTLRQYQRRVNARLLPSFGKIPLRKLRASDLDEFYLALTKAGRAPSDVRQYHAILRGALRQAVRWGWADENVALNADPPSVHRHEVRPPTPAAVLALIDAAARGGEHRNSKPRPELAVFLRLAAATGARRGEVCALRWSDLSPDGTSVTIRHSIVDALGAGRMVEKDTKTHGVRTVMLDTDTRAALAGHLRAAHLRATDASEILPTSAYVFSHHVDGSVPWRPEYVTLAFRRLAARVGLDGVRLHDLRHLAATLQLDGGVPVLTVAHRLGHRDASTTLNIYGWAVDERDRDAADLMGRSLTALPAAPADTEQEAS